MRRTTSYEPGRVFLTSIGTIVLLIRHARVRGVVNYKADPLRLSVRCTISSA